MKFSCPFCQTDNPLNVRPIKDPFKSNIHAPIELPFQCRNKQCHEFFTVSMARHHADLLNESMGLVKQEPMVDLVTVSLALNVTMEPASYTSPISEMEIDLIIKRTSDKVAEWFRDVSDWGCSGAQIAVQTTRGEEVYDSGELNVTDKFNRRAESKS